WGFAAPLILEAAIKNHIFDVLDSGPLGVDDLARQTGASPRGLRMLCDALVGLEFLSRDAADRYALTPESSAFLVSHKPSFHGFLLRHISRQLLPAWMELNDVVRTGQPVGQVNEPAEGTDFFAAFVADLFP